MDPEAPQSFQILPGGVINDLDHPNRQDQIEPWLRGEYKVIAYDEDTVVTDAQVRNSAGLTPGGRWLFDFE